jgi:hypothetical protein
VLPVAERVPGGVGVAVEHPRPPPGRAFLVTGR